MPENHKVFVALALILTTLVILSSLSGCLALQNSGGNGYLQRSQTVYPYPFYNSVWVPPHNQSISNNTFISNITLGSEPEGITYDSSNGNIYVANYGGYVSVLNGSSLDLVANISIGYGSGPEFSAFDIANGNLYVVDARNYIHIINGSTESIIGEIYLGNIGPSYAVNSIVYDAVDGYIYVSGYASSGASTAGYLSVINTVTNTIISNLSLGSSLNQMLIDPANGFLYISNGGNLSVIYGGSGSSYDYTNINLGSGVEITSLVYDSSNNYIYVTALANSYTSSGSGFISVINSQTDSIVGNITLGPGYSLRGLVFDSFNGYLYYDESVAGPDYTYSYNISVLNGETNTLVTNISIASNAYGLAFDSSNGYLFISAGTISVLQTSSDYSPNLYPITFTESGLPNTSTWSIELNNKSESSSIDTITYYESMGIYNYTIPSLAGYSPFPSTGLVTVSGLEVNENVVFTPITVRTFRASFMEFGLSPESQWSVTVNNTTVSSTSSLIYFNEPNGTFPYTIAAPWYFTQNSSGEIVVNGNLQSLQIEFYAGTSLSASGSSWADYQANQYHNGYSGWNGPLSPYQIWNSTVPSSWVGLTSNSGLLAFASGTHVDQMSEATGGIVQSMFQICNLYTESVFSVETSYISYGIGSDLWSGLSDYSYGCSPNTSVGDFNPSAPGYPYSAGQAVELSLGGHVRQSSPTFGSILLTVGCPSSYSYGTCTDNNYTFAGVYGGTVLEAYSYPDQYAWSASVRSLSNIPTIGGQLVVVGNLFDPWVNAFNAQNGQPAWNYTLPTNESLDVPASYANGVFYLSTNDGLIIAVSASGNTLWRTQLLDSPGYVSTPAIADGLIYVSYVSGLAALNATTGTVVWTNPNMGGTSTAPVVSANGVVYDGGPFGLWAINSLTGTSIWSFTAPGGSFYNSSIVLDGNGLFTEDSTGEVFAFEQNHRVVINEQGLPLGTEWNATLEGSTESSTRDQIVFNETDGSYPFNLSVSGYFGTPGRGTIVVAGASVTAEIQFVKTLYKITFNETGLSAGSNWTVKVAGSALYSNSQSISFSEPNGTYVWSTEVPGYISYPETGNITVNGLDVFQTISFHRTYIVNFTESGLPSGAKWSVTLNGTTNSSSSSAISFSERNGTYEFTIEAPSGYSTTNGGQIIVNGTSVSETIKFSPNTYSVTFTETGLPPGSIWSVTLNGTTESSANSSIDFSVQRNGSYAYGVFSSSNYSANVTTGTIVIDGAAVTQVVYFYEISDLTGTLTPSNATMYINGQLINTVDGSFNITLHSGNSYTIEVQAPGYQPYYHNITGSGSAGLIELKVTLNKLHNNPIPSDSYILGLLFIIAVVAVVAAGVRRRKLKSSNSRELRDKTSGSKNVENKGNASELSVGPIRTEVSGKYYCTNCGNSMPNEDIYCGVCGTKRSG